MFFYFHLNKGCYQRGPDSCVATKKKAIRYLWNFLQSDGETRGKNIEHCFPNNFNYKSHTKRGKSQKRPKTHHKSVMLEAFNSVNFK